MDVLHCDACGAAWRLVVVSRLVYRALYHATGALVVLTLAAVVALFFDGNVGLAGLGLCFVLWYGLFKADRGNRAWGWWRPAGAPPAGS